MLRLLSVINFATIDQLEMELAPGFNVLTGETGAGKSIILDAMSLLLGGRADGGMVRSGARQSRVEGVFLLNGDIAQKINVALDEYEIDGGEEEMILAREVNLDGRNTCRVNERIVPLGLLSTLAERLVDIHGQSQHLSLFRVREHMDVLDQYGGLWQLRTQVAERVRQLMEVRRELDRLRTDEQELAQRVDVLRYQVGEIGAANLRPAEDEDLALERDRVANAERIIALSDHAYRALYDSFDRQESVMDLIGQVAQNLAQLEQLDPSLSQDRESVGALTHQVDELAHTLRSYRDSIELNPDRLRELERRLDLIRGLKRKYGGTIEEILAFAETASEDLEKLYHSEERTEELKSREMELRGQAGRLAGQLSEARRHAAKRLADAIEEESAGLAVDHTQVYVDIRQSDSEDGVPVGTGDSGPYSTPLARIHRWTGMDGVRTAEGGEGVTGAMIRDRIWVAGRLGGGLQALLGAPMAAYSGCGERDGGIGHGKRRSRTVLARVCGDVGLAGGSVADGRRQAGSGMARSRARARLNCSSQGQRRGRCRVNRRAERVIRPAKAKTRRLRVLVVTVC